MLNILMVSGAEGTGAERYRVFHRREQLGLLGVGCDVLGISQLGTRLDSLAAIREWTDPYDVFVFHRSPYVDPIGDWLEEISAQGKPAVFDVDDLVFEPELTPFHRGVELLSEADQRQYHHGVQLYLRMVEQCDYFIGATDFLADLAARRGRKSFVDRNCLSLRTIAEAAAVKRIPRPNGDTVTIGYASGTHTHNHDFQEATDALLDVLAEFPHVRLCLFGPLDLDPRFDGFADRIDRVSLTGWEMVPQVMAAWDINLAPLEKGNPFCRSKSELKYFEAAILGLPTVASKVDAFEHAIVHGESGFLCETPDDWRGALRVLVQNVDARHRIGAAAEADARARYTPEIRAEELLNLLEGIRAQHALRQQETVPTESARPLSLKIGWVLPAPFAGSGGHMTIFRSVKFLSQFGHRCQLYFDCDGGRFTSAAHLAEFVRQNFVDTGAEIQLGFEAIEPCDALFATHWSTAHVVNGTQNCAKKLYFVQDFEPHFYPMGAEWVQAEATYRLGLRCVTIGRWLTFVLRTRYNVDADYIDFAVDTNTYHPRAVPREGQPILCALAQPEKPRRGFSLLAAALERVHRLRPDVKIVLYGSTQIPQSQPFPFVNAGLLSVPECAELFNRATVGIIFSMSNPSLIGFEMMACRCAVVDLDLENNRFDYGEDECLTLAKPDPDSIAAAAIRLLNDPAHQRRMAEKGHRFIVQRSYESSARRLEHHIIHAKECQATAGAIDRRDVAQTSYNDVVGEILPGHDVTQTFRASTDLLCRIDLFVGTYDRRNNSRLQISIRAGTHDGPEVASATIPALAMPNNDWLRVDFEPIPGSSNRTFAVVLHSPDGTYGDAVTVYYARDRELRGAKLRVGGDLRPGTLTMRTYGLRRPDLKPRRSASPSSPPPLATTLEGLTQTSASPLEPADLKLGRILQSIRRIADEKDNELRHLRHIIHAKDESIHHLHTHLTGILGSRRWKAINMVRKVLRRG